jgi:hypothetical protein
MKSVRFPLLAIFISPLANGVLDAAPEQSLRCH